MSGSFAFSQVDPNTQGEVTDMQVPISRYLDAEWDQGKYDSTFANLSRATEMNLESSDNSKVISPDEANERFGDYDLKFDNPIKTGVAELMAKRAQMQRERSFYLAQPDHSLTESVAGTGIGMVSSMMNPLDFGLMFMPFVGEEAEAARLTADGANVMGRGMLARGLITSETLAKVSPYPKFTASVINGAVSQAALDIPKAITSELPNSTDPYELSDLPKNMAAGALTAGAFHLVHAGVAKLLDGLTGATKTAMLQKALDDFSKGKDIDLQKLAGTDNQPADSPRVQDLVDNERQTTDISGNKTPESREELDEQSRQPTGMTPEEVSRRYQPEGQIEPKDIAFIDDDIKNLKDQFSDERSESEHDDLDRVDQMKPQSDVIDSAADCLGEKEL